MGVYAHWKIAVCPICGRFVGGRTTCIGPRGREHEKARTMWVDVVRASDYQGAVQALRDIHQQTPRLPATDPVTGEPSPWTIAADYFTDFGGQ